jgi:hypothetical protein
MTYIFTCPAPCNRVIRIDANDADDAIRKIVKAGGMACRNGERPGSCGESHPQMLPLPERMLKDLVRFIMTEVDGEGGYNRMPAALE